MAISQNVCEIAVFLFQKLKEKHHKDVFCFWSFFMVILAYMGRKKYKDEDDDIEEDGDGEGFISVDISSDTKRTILAIILFLWAAIFLLGFFNMGGILGEKMVGSIGIAVGWGKVLTPLLFIFLGVILLKRKRKQSFYFTRIIGLLVAFFSILSLMHLIPFDHEQMGTMAREGVGGGYIGYGVATLLYSFTGKLLGSLILIATIIIGVLIAFNFSFVRDEKVKHNKRSSFQLRMPSFGRSKDDEADDDEEYEEEYEDDEEGEQEDEETDEDAVEEGEDDTEEEIVEEKPKKGLFGMKKAKKNHTQKWDYAPSKLFERAKGSAKAGNTERNAEVIEETLSNFNIDVELDSITTGPSVTQYAFHPPTGVKLSKITALNADLALALAAHPIRIEAPIPGKSLVGIEVPNRETVAVRMRDLLASRTFTKHKSGLMLALGETVDGEYEIADLAKMPHLLVAGTTGTGKSVAVNSMILSLLYQNSPEELKLILVDPKRVELSLYNGIPHLLTDVIVDSGKVLNALKWAVGEMERRYILLQETGSRDIESYKKKQKTGGVRTHIDEETQEEVTEEMENLPVIVIVIDELADLMMSHGKDVEAAIVRLAQMSRAVGIHLIVSTQRPSVEVITGLIKANLPTRIALRVSTQIDSRTILDSPGAEKLIGRGDMLYKSGDSGSSVRLQGVLIDEEEVKRVVAYLVDQADEYDDENELDITANRDATPGSPDAQDGSGSEGDDVLYEEAKKIVIEAGKASTSYIQRRLKVGYSRAARLVDLLEENGVVGPANGSKPRDVLVTGESSSDPQYEDDLKDQAQRDKWQA